MPASEELFVDFVRPHLGRLRVVAHQYARNAEDARDLIQETLLRAWRDMAAAEGRVRHRGWLLAILRNVARDWSRLASRRIRLEPIGDFELTELVAADLREPLAPVTGMTEAQFREFLDERVASALDVLEDPYREVLILSVAGDLRYAEIAEMLGCPMGTVMSRIARARRRLREHLADMAPRTQAARPHRP